MTRTGLMLITALVLLAGACKQGEGDRCNPLLLPFHDECGNGLMCTTPPNCVVSVCCAVAGDAGTIISTIPSCQPCPTADMGAGPPDMVTEPPDMATVPADMATGHPDAKADASTRG